jgi:hypothetical protein
LASLRSRIDLIIAEKLDHMGNVVSGLELSEIGEDGHALANKLWKVAHYLRTRSE